MTDLDAYQAEVRAFIAEKAPKFPIRAGVRSPESVEEQQQLRQWTAELYAAGYLGASWPTQYGGQDDDDTEKPGIIAQELALAHAPGPIGASPLVSQALIHFGTAAQCERYLPAIRTSEEIWCQLFSEPDAGSDLAGMRTRAVLDGDHYVVNGQKVWTTNGHWSEFGYLLARTDPDAPKHRGISAFAVDMKTPGITVRPLREITGTSDFNEVFFDDVRVPVENLIGEANQGWLIANSSLAHERSGVAGNVVTLRELWSAVWSRAQQLPSGPGEPVVPADVQETLMRLYADIEALALVVQGGLERWRDGKERPLDAPIAKLMFSEINLALAEASVTMLGSQGVLVEGDPGAVDDGRWQDGFLYARAYTIAGGSSEIMRNLIAERGLGLPRG